MTREDFENVGSWSELLSICWEYDLTICEDVMDDEGILDAIQNIISYDRPSYAAINNIASLLRGYDSDSDYHFNDDGELTPLDDLDFDSYKRDVYTALDDGDYWDDDDETDEWDVYDWDDGGSSDSDWYEYNNVVNENINIQAFMETINF